VFSVVAKFYILFSRRASITTSASKEADKDNSCTKVGNFNIT
jgi:hypothetical protein